MGRDRVESKQEGKEGSRKSKAGGEEGGRDRKEP